MAKRSQFQGAGPSQRQLRVGEEVRHILSQAFIRQEFYAEALKRITLTIPEVQVSPDLRHARAYIYPIGGSAAIADILKALNDLGPELRTIIARQMTTKYIPRLQFRLDETFEEAAKIEDLLRDDRVARDLDRSDECDLQENNFEDLGVEDNQVS